MRGRGLLLASWLLGGCLSASEGAGGDDPRDGAPDPVDCDLGLLMEDFEEEDWVDSRWGESWEDQTGMLQAVDGQAVIEPTGGADEYAYFETTATFDWEGRCVHAEVPTMLTLGEEVDSEALIGVFLGESVWVTLGPSNGLMCCQVDVDDLTTEAHCDVSYDSTAHRWWRLRFDGDQAVCEVAPAKGEWSELARVTVDPDTFVGPFDLYAGTWNFVEDPGAVAFDNVNR